MRITTSVYLDEADKRSLTAYPRSIGTSEAELLRRGVRLVLAQAERPRPRVAGREFGRPSGAGDGRVAAGQRSQQLVTAPLV